MARSSRPYHGPCPRCAAQGITRPRHVNRHGNNECYCSDCMRAIALESYHKRRNKNPALSRVPAAPKRDTAYDAPRQEGNRRRWPKDARPPLSAQRQAEIEAQFRQMVAALEARNG